MSEDAFTLKEMLKEMRLDMQEHNDRSIRIEETLNSVLAQAIKTNGRVTALEINDNKQDKKINRFQTVISTVFTILGAAWGAITFLYK